MHANLRICESASSHPADKGVYPLDARLHAEVAEEACSVAAVEPYALRHYSDNIRHCLC
jgi:hypothetical protein